MGKWVAGVLSAVVAGVILIYVTDFLAPEPPPKPSTPEPEPPAEPASQDVKLTAFNVDAGPIRRDKQFYINIELTNDGVEPSVPMFVRVKAYQLLNEGASGVLSQDGGGELIAEEEIEPIDGDATLARRIRCKAPLAPGTYDLALTFTARDDGRRLDLVSGSNFVEVQ